MSKNEKTAIVTGAARGIGKAIALALAQERINIILVDIKSCNETISLIQKQGLSCLDIPTDVSNFIEVQKMVKRVLKEFSNIDILVNNAGIISRTNFIDLNLEEWRRILAVNLDGTFHCCLSVVPEMVKHHKGKIINITSIAGVIGDITASPVYGTSKGAINILTKSLARQLAPYGITVNAIAPHAIETDMSSEWSEEKRQEVIKSIPLGRLGQPEEVAAAVVFLTSQGANFITGEILNINGGFLMH